MEYVAADIGSNPGPSSSLATVPIRVMTEMRDNGTVAFIGPDGTCSAEALVAAAWNLPIISYVSTHFFLCGCSIILFVYIFVKTT